MARNIHKNYDKLTPDGIRIVDKMYDALNNEAKYYDITLRGDDTAEVLVDAIAKLVIESTGSKFLRDDIE